MNEEVFLVIPNPIGRRMPRNRAPNPVFPNPSHDFQIPLRPTHNHDVHKYKAGERPALIDYFQSRAVEVHVHNISVDLE